MDTNTEVFSSDLAGSDEGPAIGSGEDRALLGAAAGAAGIPAPWSFDKLAAFQYGAMYWNPLEENAQAFQLAVQLQIPIQHAGNWVAAYAGQSVMSQQVSERVGNDRAAATRRAIVRAAALSKISTARGSTPEEGGDPGLRAAPAAGNLRRFTIRPSIDDDGVDFICEPDGEWVRYDDMHKLMNLLLEITHHEGALEECKPLWQPIVREELKRRAAERA